MTDDRGESERSTSSAPAGGSSAGSDASGTVTEVAESIERAVSAIARWNSRPDVRRAVAAGTELTATDAWLLARLGTEGACRLTELARWQAVDKSTMTVQVRRLEERGLIERRPDPADGRATLIDATPAGRAALDDGRAIALGLLGAAVADWSARDRRRFAELLERFVAGLADSTGALRA